jgi:hypothetical protein
LLARLNAQKKDLLAVLARPEIPLHTNGSENDIRCQVTRRKISVGTRSDQGRDCRDAFLALMKTCAKQAVRFWHYLGDRLQCRRRRPYHAWPNSSASPPQRDGPESCPCYGKRQGRSMLKRRFSGS